MLYWMLVAGMHLQFGKYDYYTRVNQSPEAHIGEVLVHRSAGLTYASLVLCACSSRYGPAFLGQAEVRARLAAQKCLPRLDLRLKLSWHFVAAAGQGQPSQLSGLLTGRVSVSGLNLAERPSRPACKGLAVSHRKQIRSA